MVRLTKKQQKTTAVIALVVFAILLAAIGILAFKSSSLGEKLEQSRLQTREIQELTGVGEYGSQHVHANFAVFIDGKEADFAKAAFFEKNSLSHLHAGQNNHHVIHAHAAGITYGMFFSSIGVELGDCLVIGDKDFCDSGRKTVKYYVNGRIDSDLKNLQVNDLDRVLLTYGSEDYEGINTQLKSVGDDACIQSGKCPERGEGDCSGGACPADH